MFRLRFILFRVWGAGAGNGAAERDYGHHLNRTKTMELLTRLSEQEEDEINQTGPARAEPACLDCQR